MLITNKTYNQEANELADKITLMTKERYSKWLISHKYIVDQSDVDGVLSRQSEFCDTVIIKEAERVTENQRLLLECESARVEEKQKALIDRQKVFQSVVDEVTRYTEELMINRLSELNVLRLFGKFPDFSYFLEMAYSPSLTYSKLSTLITNDNQLKNNVVELVNNPKFCSRIGKSVRGIADPKVALGVLGIDNCKVLFPILMAKPLLRWHEKVTKAIAPKLWQHMILTANVTKLRLQDAELKNSEQGIALGVLRTISYFAIVNQFPQLFEDALIEKMQDFRNKDQREQYYACAEIKPTLKVLPNVIIKLEENLTRKVVESIEWTPFNIHLKNALLEDLDHVPVKERSDHGKALAQALAYSVYDSMDRSNAFVEKHKPFWFASVLMPPESLKKLRAVGAGKKLLQ
ncbi:HDOD domain-containing protein [Vibrio sp. TRT 17S01]|uniref:HDOD domain-containing protein n=1 Tax=Vibrio sp. TRT 17S01 TaxID=3418505 RepID=UPI003CFB81A5